MVRMKRALKTLERLEFTRGKSMPTEISDRTVWFSKCGRYAVARWRPCISGLQDYFQALIVRDGNMVEVIGRTKTRLNAERICRRHVTDITNRQTPRK